ncbi:MAG: DNA polymerase III, subunit gamma and tau [Elusimicrobia bacterium GWC2_51_8]|nr:MAG: DNA polymerase III, subunit gamma and tau [Elusimicrobia bacterium GWA2_51_34]OGR58837.1 MAG: DNA polymerase III, subunit gamma and tau [Elusimicrobia bacterium GWC2_51_8]OGR87079.1 MAG: DNA polymerase III, subunit gamma and tau [Elusimicrobia bacterium GWF2_52_66]HAF96056.1 DNA polymerase III, subunit gamma and tau [Elusimicrobiota bacterium]HCE98664.1 DNA polymerase III subunit gamma/tau [Elusimicrobiota bacterium]
MPYENLASKYRPKNLNEVLGQETVKRTLTNAVKLGRIAPSYVFYGPRGTGKTTIARILAKTLNCHNPAGAVPCDKCASCLEIAGSKSLDVIEIDAASNTQVDKVRNVIIENVAFAPSRDKYKVYILDEVHMLTTQAFNALLKTVEEPPAHVVFIMATTEQHKVPVTILSRSQCFRFRPLSEEIMFERLKAVAEKEKIKSEPEALAMIARASCGSMRDAMTLLDRAISFGRGEVKTEVLNELLGHAGEDIINSLALALVNRDSAALHAAFDKLNSEGYDTLTALRDLRDLLAGTFFYLQKFSSASTALARALPKDLSASALAKLSRKVNLAVEEVKFSDSLAIAAEMALFTLVDTPQDIDALVRRLEGLELRLAPPPASGPAVPASAKQLGGSASVGKVGQAGGGVGGQGRPPVIEPCAALPPVQKKNDILETQPGKSGPDAGGQRLQEEDSGISLPVTCHLPPVTSGAVAQTPPSALWKKLLVHIASKKPMVYNMLLSVKITFDSETKWRLSLPNKFEAGMIEKARPELEEAMQNLSGRKIEFVIEHPVAVKSAVPVLEDLSAPQVSSDVEPEAEVLTGPQEPEGRWEDLPEAGVSDIEPELKKLSKVFHGSKITKVSKKTVQGKSE